MTSTGAAMWLIGHDGSDNARRAFDWARTQASGRDVELSVIRTWQVPALDYPLSSDSIDQFAPERVCEEFDDLVAEGDDTGIPVSGRIVRGSAASKLLDESEAAALLVLGSRGLGGFRRLLLGSVSSQCATHAVVPTIVVPPRASTDTRLRRIVVGLDGSDRALCALDWAVEFAPDDCEIKVVGAWMPSRSGYVAVTQHYTDERAATEARFNELLDARDAEMPGRLVRRFAFADPTNALLDEAEAADLVVVGQRGHSGLSGAILGSVTTHVLHHSPVPVAVVPGSD